MKSRFLVIIFLSYRAFSFLCSMYPFFCHRGSSEYQAIRIFRIAHDHKHCLQWIKSTFYAFHAGIKTFYVDTKHITTGFFRIIERQIHPKSLLSTNPLYELTFSLATSKIQFSVFFYTCKLLA